MLRGISVVLAERQLHELMDTITANARSALMSRIRSKNTRPERAVRSILHGLGYRFRLHLSDLPGRPDIVLPRHRKIVLVQGCFWHGHSCSLGSKPKSNSGYWRAKIRGNRARDRRHMRALTKAGWQVLELWECEIRANVDIVRRLQEFMVI
jgi:DNA mismatch endonuclease (patch repair protein)